ncbi:hypothetical protein OAF85_01330 [Planctomycetota bacterium]|nr:hypothetical protein [Planctomycetota bacterium]
MTPRNRSRYALIFALAALGAALFLFGGDPDRREGEAVDAARVATEAARPMPEATAGGSSGPVGSEQEPARELAAGLILASRDGVPVGGTASLVHGSGRYVRGDFGPEGSLGALADAFMELLAAGRCDLVIESDGCATQRLRAGGDAPGPPFRVALGPGTDLTVALLDIEGQPLEADLVVASRAELGKAEEIWKTLVFTSHLTGGSGTVTASQLGDQPLWPTSLDGTALIPGLPRGPVEVIVPSIRVAAESARGILTQEQQTLTVQEVEPRSVRVLAVDGESAPAAGYEVRICTRRVRGGAAAPAEGFAQVAKGVTDRDGLAEFADLPGEGKVELFAILSRGNDWYRSEVVPLDPVTEVAVVASADLDSQFARATDGAGRPVKPSSLRFSPGDAETDLEANTPVDEGADPLHLPLAVRYQRGQLAVQGHVDSSLHPDLVPVAGGTLEGLATEVHLEFGAVRPGAGTGDLVIHVPAAPDGDLVEVTLSGLRVSKEPRSLEVADGRVAVKGLRDHDYFVAVQHAKFGQWLGSASVPNGANAEVTAQLTTGVAVEITCREGAGPATWSLHSRGDLGYGSLAALVCVASGSRVLEPGPPVVCPQAPEGDLYLLVRDLWSTQHHWDLIPIPTVRTATGARAVNWPMDTAREPAPSLETTVTVTFPPAASSIHAWWGESPNGRFRFDAPAQGATTLPPLPVGSWIFFATTDKGDSVGEVRTVLGPGAVDLDLR